MNELLRAVLIALLWMVALPLLLLGAAVLLFLHHFAALLEGGKL